MQTNRHPFLVKLRRILIINYSIVILINCAPLYLVFSIHGDQTSIQTLFWQIFAVSFCTKVYKLRSYSYTTFF